MSMVDQRAAYLLEAVRGGKWVGPSAAAVLRRPGADKTMGYADHFDPLTGIRVILSLEQAAVDQPLELHASVSFRDPADIQKPGQRDEALERTWIEALFGDAVQDLQENEPSGEEGRFWGVKHYWLTLPGAGET